MLQEPQHLDELASPFTPRGGGETSRILTDGRNLVFLDLSEICCATAREARGPGGY
jgi:hypothetical protein